jgi:hypothetical protein
MNVLAATEREILELEIPLHVPPLATRSEKRRGGAACLRPL